MPRPAARAGRAIRGVDDVFAAGGLLAAHFDGYQPRAGQLDLTRAIERALERQEHLLAEAPTGTGKSLAYSVPAILHAVANQQRVVIATANIALQEQLIKKDLPLLATLLPRPFRFALLKGKRNYLCLDRVSECSSRPSLLPADRAEEAAIRSWRTQTGDVSDLPFAPRPHTWARVSIAPEQCKRTACQFHASCFAELAKKRAAAADIVVTNFHQLFAHIAVRRLTGGDHVLPPFQVLICDEAHELADIARGFFGAFVTEAQLLALAAFLSKSGDARLAEVLRTESTRFFSALALHPGRVRCPHVVCGEVLLATLDAAQSALEDRAAALAEERERRRCQQAAERAKAFRDAIDGALTLSDENLIYSVTQGEAGALELRSSLVSVAALVRREVFGKLSSAILVSGTLAVGDSFTFIQRELGIPQGTPTLVAETPFDYAAQGLLVIPKTIPPPEDADYPAAIARHLTALARDIPGGILALFTSYRNLDAVARTVELGDRTVLRQGQASAADLTDAFRADERSVLLATTSFWTGIDVPGPALTLLVIDKMPFPHRSDPVVEAITERDERAFQNFLLPKAIMTLRQGVGRLIRSRTDVGAVLLCDRRLLDKRYGARVLRSLPPMQRSDEVASIRTFLRGPLA